AVLLLRGIGGAASAFALVFASALVLDRLAAAGRGGLAALHFAGVGVGVAASAMLVALPGVGWRGLWVASGLVSLAAVGVVARVAWPGTAGALVAAALLGGTFMGLTALGLAGGRALAAGDPQRTFAVLTAAFGLGQIVGPALAGLLHDRTGSFGLP